MRGQEGIRVCVGMSRPPVAVSFAHLKNLYAVFITLPLLVSVALAANPNLTLFPFHSYVPTTST